MKNQLSAICFATIQNEYASKRLLVRLAVIRIAVAALVLVISTFAAKAQTRVYVDAAISASGAGTTWVTAYKTVQEALDAAAANSQIKEVFIKKGTYLPSKTGDGCVRCPFSDFTFRLRNNLAIYGGFAGGETDTANRNFAANPVILSGGPNPYTQHVVFGMDCDNTCVLDGLTITKGNAVHDSKMTINGFEFSNREGGGMYLRSSNPILRNIIFTENIGYYKGSALLCSNSSPQIINCTFTNNQLFGDGTIYYDLGSNASVITNSVFANNYISSIISDPYSVAASGIYNKSGRLLTINGCRFDNNTAGFAIVLDQSPVIINNSSFSNHPKGAIMASASATITNTLFTANGGSWGPIYAGTDMTVSRCRFYGNNAQWAGAIWQSDGAVTISNSLFYNNSAKNTESSAGAIYNTNGSLNVHNSNFWGNSGYEAGAIRGGNNNPNVYNSIFYNNNSVYENAPNYDFRYNKSVYNNCLVQSNYPNITGTNISVGNGAPFANAADADGPDNLPGTMDDGMRLAVGSVGINAGDLSYLPAGEKLLDLPGSNRIQGGQVDIGCYEDAVVCPNYSRMYVDAAMITSGTGQSWGTAFKSLQEALTLAVKCPYITEVWVKKGTYYPSKYLAGCTNCGNRDNVFLLKNNLAIYGGFTGTETAIGQRNFAASPTVLSGNIGNTGVNTDNSHHLLAAFGCNGSAILDGFTIKESYPALLPGDLYMRLADGQQVPRDVGGGIYNYQSSPTIKNCIFGSLYSYATIWNDNGSSPSISNTVLANNVIGQAIYNKTNSSPIITNCVITANGSISTTGSALYNIGGSNPVLTSTTIAGNNYQDGLIYSNASSPTLQACIVWSNTSNTGNAPSIVNSGGTTTATYSLVQGGFSGTGNISSNPLFVNAADPDGADNIYATADDGLMISCASPAQDTVVGSGLPATDILYVARPQGPKQDMGAYEQQASTVAVSVSISSNAPASMCTATSILFTAIPVNGGTPAYQWKKNGTPINGATQATYAAAPSTFANGDQITVTLTTSFCSKVPTVTSNAITLQLPNTLYVDAGIGASGNGYSWATALKTLDEALLAAQYCPLVEKIMVARGTYIPKQLPYNMGADKIGVQITSADNREKTFHIRAGLEVYGGYPSGGGTQNIGANPTILDGLGVGGISGAYAYHVVILDSSNNWAATNDTARLIGFTIRNGKADGSGSLTLNNGSIRRDFGGGLFVCNATNILSDNIFTLNNATAGGGLFALNGRNIIRRNVFADNNTTSSGAGFYTRFAETRAYNNIFVRNHAVGIGGGTMMDNGVNYITNNTYFANNAGDNGGALHAENGVGTYRNNIFWGNMVNNSLTAAGADYHKNSSAVNLFTNNLMQLPAASYTTGDNGGYDIGADATANLFATDPLFTNTASLAGGDGRYGTTDDGLMPACASPVQNQGTATDAPASAMVGTARPQGSGYDMGAYENILETTPPTISNCPPSIEVCTGAPVYWTAPTASDNCGIRSLTSNFAPGSIFPPGNTVVTYTATDMAGYTSQCSFTLKAIWPSTNTVGYVTPGGAGLKDGTSWANAFDGLQAGMNAARTMTCITQLWVKGGEYRPSSVPARCQTCDASDSKQYSFSLQNNLAIYGGFAGTENSLAERNIQLNKTTLSGYHIDLSWQEAFDFYDLWSRSMHVVMSRNNDRTAVLDGFTVSDGLSLYASDNTDPPYMFFSDIGELSNTKGFGMYNSFSSPTIVNCTFVDNMFVPEVPHDDGIRGGGVYNYESSPLFKNCVFKNNTANRGAAVFTEMGAAEFEKCSFVGNGKGSAVEELWFAQNRYDNCVFFANERTSSVNYSTLTNCTMHEQPATALFTAPNTVIKNLITDGDVVGDAIITHSITKNALAGTGNSTATPLFVNTNTHTENIFFPLPVPDDANGLRLQPCSPGINEGSNAAVASIATDIQTNSRIYGGRVDMGAYELQSLGRNSLAINGDEATQNITGSTLLATTDCRAVGYVQPNGNQPVSGVINTKVWVEQAIPYYRNVPYVARHFDLKPTTNTASATARITLYFSQQDFNLFNAENTDDPVYSLPASENDATGKSNLRVFQFHGDGGATGLPGSYTSGFTMINPADEDIFWNTSLQRWEVSFNISGFSGFFASVDPLIILPLQSISFTGKLNASQQAVNLSWQVAGQTGVEKYVVERAVNNGSFNPIGWVTANGLASSSYTFADAVLPSGSTLLYRLKIVNTDGKFTYSKIIAFSTNKSQSTHLYPNPASREVFLSAAESSLLGTDAILTDVWGRILQRIKIIRWPQKINTASLAAGFYFIKTADERTLRLVIEK